MVFGRKSVESNVPKALKDGIHLLDEYFEVIQVEDTAGNQKDVGKFGVHFYKVKYKDFSKKTFRYFVLIHKNF